MVRSRDTNAENVGGLSMIEICPTEYKIISVDGHYMIEVRITEQMREKALRHAMKDKDKYGNYNTIFERRDKDRFIGSLGEEVVSSYFNIKLEHLKGNDKYDIIINQELVEVKSRNLDKGIPHPPYECNIPSPSNICDRYIFVVIHGSYTKGWIVGTCTREEFEDKSYIAYAKIKDRKTDLIHRIKIQDLEDVVSWQSKFGRTAGAYGLMRRQADS
jgi:hypothetical protein